MTPGGMRDLLLPGLSDIEGRTAERLGVHVEMNLHMDIKTGALQIIGRKVSPWGTEVLLTREELEDGSYRDTLEAKVWAFAEKVAAS